MQKLLMILLSVLLFLLVTLSVLFLFSFTQKGNTLLQPYVVETLEEKIGLPVEIKSFTLEFGTVRLTFVVDNKALVEAASHYDLLDLSYEGIYQISAKGFSYEDVILGQSDLKGDFKGVWKEIDVKGQGSALDANMKYSFKIMNKVAQKIILQVKGAELTQVLKLLGKPALAQGKIDIEVNMPNIGEDKAEGYGHMLLHQASFNRPLVKKLYGYSLPEKSDINAKAEAKLQGDLVRITGDMQSDIFNVEMKDTVYHVANKLLKGVYDLDVKDMRILTKNKLAGAFKARGNIEVDKGDVQVTGKSTSFDGELRFSVAKSAKVTLEKLSLQKVLPLFKQAVYAKGIVSGTFLMDDVSKESGEYDLRIDKGRLLSKSFAKKMDLRIPEKNLFSLSSKGKIDKKKLTAEATLHSTLSDMTFSSLKYDLKDKTLSSNYDAVFHDITLLLPKAKVKKGEKFSANGALKYKEILTVSGALKGLGKKVTFEYDSKKANIDASKLFIGKLLALTGVPVYAKGTVDANIAFTDIKAKEGTFSLKGTNLVTQPDEMKKWMGKALKTKLVLESSGRFKKEKIYMTTEMKTPLGNISLKNTEHDKKRKSVKSAYVIDIPELKKLQPYIDKKLYGPMVLKGVFSKEKILKLTGSTTSLGGKINYTLHGKELRSTITAVPLLNILGVLGHKKNFLGQAFGKGTYNVKQKSGVVDLDIRSFQIKPSTLTNTIKMFLGKDPARIIFSSTKFHADIQKKITTYTLLATGTRSSITIRNGKINKVTNEHRANFTLVYEKYTVHGKIKGSADHPEVTLDTNTLLKEQLSNGKLKEKLEKALGGKAEKFLKGLSF